jgi:hypothetical protein
VTVVSVGFGKLYLKTAWNTQEPHHSREQANKELNERGSFGYSEKAQQGDLAFGLTPVGGGSGLTAVLSAAAGCRASPS